MNPIRRIFVWLRRDRPPRGGHQSGSRTVSQLRPPPDSVSKMTQAELAAWLIHIARDLRTAGDVKLFELGEDGVSEYWLTLAGELKIIAMQIDYDECMRLAAEPPG